MDTLTVTLAPWAVARIVKDYGKPGQTGVNKSMLRRSLVDFPDTEFASPVGYLTIREAQANRIDLLQVRKPNGDLLAVINVSTDGYEVA